MKTYLSALSLLAGVALAQGVWAQSEVVPVGQRMAAAHAPQGVRAGSFLVIPKVDLEESYKDNIYATKSNTKDDFITTVRPEIAARSNWSRHQVNALARGEFQRFADHTKENQDNYLVATDGRLDVLRDTSIGGGVSYAKDHEERGNPNSPSTASKPTEYNTTTARVGAERSLGVVNARIDSEAKKIDYKNGVTTAGALVDNNARDRMEYTQTLRVGYKFDPRYEAFVRGSIDTRAYDRKGGTTVNRSNHGSKVVAGSTFDISGKTKGEVFAGAVRRNYVDNGLKDITEPTWGGTLTWNATDLTTVTANVDRTIEETTLGSSSGYVATGYDLGVEHALTRDVLLNAKAGYADNMYKGNTAGQRKDKVWTAGAGADYYFGRCFKTGVGYTYQNRDSNISGGGYSSNAVMLKLTANY